MSGSTTEPGHQGEEVLMGRMGERREAALGQRQTLKGDMGDKLKRGLFFSNNCV